MKTQVPTKPVLPADSGSAGKVKVEFSQNQVFALVNFYWRARVNFDKIFEFFVNNCPRYKNDAVSALIFQPNRRLRTLEFKRLIDLKRQIPDDASFVRLEHGGHGHVQSHAPDFIVWARIDLQDVHIGTPAPDYMGVSAESSRMADLNSSFAAFISETHIEPIYPSEASDMLRRLLDRYEPT
jgi:hypothetical protein